MSVYTGFNVVGTLLFSLLSGKLIDGWFGYRFTDTLGALVVAAGVGVIASSTIYEVTLVGGTLKRTIHTMIRKLTAYLRSSLGTGFLAGCGTGLATSAQMALNSRVLSKNDKNEDVSNAKDMGMMSNNTNLAQILATSVNGFLLDYFKEYVQHACLFASCATGLTILTQSQAPHGRQANQLCGRVRNWYRISPPGCPAYLARARCSIAVVMGSGPRDVMWCLNAIREIREQVVGRQGP